MDQDASETPHPRIGPGLLAAGLIVGVWATLPPFVGPGLTTELSTEIVDHPVPSLFVLAVVAWASWARRASELRLFAAGLTIVLAGVWMTATHLPLVAQAVSGQVGWAPTISHTLPGLAVLGLGAVWTLRYR